MLVNFGGDGAPYPTTFFSSLSLKFAFMLLWYWYTAICAGVTFTAVTATKYYAKYHFRTFETRFCEVNWYLPVYFAKTAITAKCKQV